MAPARTSSLLPSVGFLSDVAVIPGALAALQQDPRTHALHRDLIAAELLLATSLMLSMLLLELRRRQHI